MKRKICLLITLFLLLLVGCSAQPQVSATPTPAATEAPITVTPEPTPEPIAEPVTDGVCIRIDGIDHTQKLSDGKHLSIKSIPKNKELSVEAQQPFSAVYVEWDRLPEVYSICWADGSMECGREGFLHDYIRLPKPVTQVTFVFPADTAQSICDIALYTEGSAPAGVQDWLEPCDTADILVFPTHSDDDVFFFGPMIAYYVIEQQLTVQTAFMVNHTATPERAHERLNGLWELGVRHYPILGDAPDMGIGELQWGLTYYNRHTDIYSWQMEQIRRFQPLVILGHDPDGEYGNMGHKVNTYYLMQTVLDAAVPEKHPNSAKQYGVWDTPKLYLHLYEENNWMFDVNAVMTNDAEGRTPLEVANIALDCHVSQNGTGMSVYQDEYLPTWDCRPFGLYRSLVGSDTKADIMENIIPEDWR